MAGAVTIATLYPRHCEEHSDEAIHLTASGQMDCFAALAMTAECGALPYLFPSSLLYDA
jgi:hypothetical protein